MFELIDDLCVFLELQHDFPPILLFVFENFLIIFCYIFINFNNPLIDVQYQTLKYFLDG